MIIKVFVKRTIVSIETVLSAYTRTHARTHTHTHTHTQSLTKEQTAETKKK